MKQTTIAAGATELVVERGITSGEIIVEEGAQLDLHCVQLEAAADTPIEKKIVLHKDAVVRMFTGLFDSTNLKVVGHLEGAHATFEHHAVYFGTKREQMTMEFNSEHNGVNGLSRIMVRGVALGNAFADFTGSINIHQPAKGTDGHLEHEGLLLSKKARINALPGFEVLTDDVKAVHSSAVHYLRPEQLFYLQSRGVNEAAAKEMIVHGFLHELLAIVHDEPFAATIEETLKDKLASLNA